MTEPWDGMSKEPLTENELRKLRFQMQFIQDHQHVIRYATQIYRVWWLLPLGIVLAISGSLGAFLKVITKEAGL